MTGGNVQFAGCTRHDTHLAGHRCRRALPYGECRKAVGLGRADPALFVVHWPMDVGRCPTLNATRPLALDGTNRHCSLSIVHCPLFIVHCPLFIVHCSLSIVHCSLFIERVIYTTLTHVCIRICNYHLFLVTLLMQSNKRSVFPPNVHPSAFIVRTPNPLKGALPFA